MALSNLKIEIKNENNVTTIVMIGEARLDVEAAETQLDRVVVHHPKTVIVDCSQLTFLSSIGMSLLVKLRRNTVAHGGIVKLAGIQPMVKGALQHACLLPLFEVHDTMATAQGAPQEI